MNARQIRFDFEREQRERRQLIQAVTHTRAGLSQRRWVNAQRVLLFLVNCDRGLGSFPFVASIAANCQVSPRTVDRAIKDLKAIGVLDAELQKTKSGRGANKWHIDFARLASLSGVNPRQIGVNLRQIGVNRRQNGVNPLKELTLTQPLDNPSSTSTATSSLVTPTARVEEAVKDLANQLRARLDAPELIEPAIRDAIANGCTMQQIYARCDWFHQNQERWSKEHRPGALHYGLKHATPGHAPHKGWPYLRRANR